ncbi:MAG: flagellar hook-basal body complex protein FliE [Rhizobiaceae bacterium]|nr:flagellar hook-basal body complex protein FliE [Rhizobiaceae bacterium]
MSAITQISLLKPFADPTALSNVGSGSLTPGASSAVGEIDFGAMVKDMVNKTTTSLQNAEATSIQGIKGEASAHDVATAVMEAEQSLRMAISVRDKVVQAYLEISRMQI